MTRERTVLAIGLQVQVIVPQAEIDHELLGVAEFMIVVQPTNVMYWHYSLFIGYFSKMHMTHACTDYLKVFCMSCTSTLAVHTSFGCQRYA